MKRARANGERGMVLGIVLITAIIFSMAAYAMLMVALNQRRRIKEFDVDRLRARYAAEAGLVWARENLWSNPAWPPGCAPGSTGTIALPAQVNQLTVTVDVSNCGANRTHLISAKVIGY